jgi:hypothetical protein
LLSPDEKLTFGRNRRRAFIKSQIIPNVNYPKHLPFTKVEAHVFFVRSRHHIPEHNGQKGQASWGKKSKNQFIKKTNSCKKILAKEIQMIMLMTILIWIEKRKNYISYTS